MLILIPFRQCFNDSFSVFIPLLAIVFKGVIFFVEHFAIEDVHAGRAESADSFIIDQFEPILLLQVFIVVDSFGIVPDRGREYAVHCESIG